MLLSCGSDSCIDPGFYVLGICPHILLGGIFARAGGFSVFIIIVIIFILLHQLVAGALLDCYSLAVRLPIVVPVVSAVFVEPVDTAGDGPTYTLWSAGDSLS